MKTTQPLSMVQLTPFPCFHSSFPFSASLRTSVFFRTIPKYKTPIVRPPITPTHLPHRIRKSKFPPAYFNPAPIINVQSMLLSRVDHFIHKSPYVGSMFTGPPKASISTMFPSDVERTRPPPPPTSRHLNPAYGPTVILLKLVGGVRPAHALSQGYGGDESAPCSGEM